MKLKFNCSFYTVHMLWQILQGGFFFLLLLWRRVYLLSEFIEPFGYKQKEDVFLNVIFK